jgi:hypothetical protein
MEAVTLNTPKNTIASIPALLGFMPEASVVVLFFQDNRLTLTARADEDTMLAEIDELTSFCMSLSELHNFTSFIVVYFGDDTQSFMASVSILEETCNTREASPALIDAMHIGSDRKFFSITEGERIEGGSITEEDYTSSAVAMGVVLSGNKIAASREELEAEITVPKKGGKPFEDAQRVVEGIKGDKALKDYRWAAYTFGTAVLDGDEFEIEDVIAMGLMAEDVNIRDAYLHHVASLSDPRVVGERFFSALSRMPEDHAPPLLSMAAITSFLCGDGARASMAASRALSIDDGYALARLMIASLASAMPPDQWRDAVRELDIEGVLSQ